jgi:peptidoglycan/xylan/chitin deacetylase (PgdA/CDA1 family)
MKIIKTSSARKFLREELTIVCVLFIGLGCACTLAIPGAATPTPTPSQPQDTLVSLTFDDGNADNFAVAPVLKQYGLHATFYIPSGLVGSNGFMTWEQLQALQNDGNEIGGHTLDHIKLGGLDPQALRHEVCDDRQNLLGHGLYPVSFAYPFGNYDQEVSQIVRECGYTNARTILGGPQRMPFTDPYALLAFPYIVNDTGLGKLEAYVGGTRREGGGWVIFIFHHVCDSCDFFSVKPQVLNDYIPWLAEQQSNGHIKVLTMGEVVSGTTSP